jgi:hypothetical protein
MVIIFSLILILILCVVPYALAQTKTSAGYVFNLIWMYFVTGITCNPKDPNSGYNKWLKMSIDYKVAGIDAETQDELADNYIGKGVFQDYVKSLKSKGCG